MASLSELTTLRVGGPIEQLLEPATTEELVATLADVWRAGDDWLVIGGGSNLVVSDLGFDGTVIRVATAGIRIEEVASDGSVRVHAAAGVGWDDLVAACVDAGLAGIEAMSGIPGTVGAAPVQNIGAYGQELSDVLEGVTVAVYPEAEVRAIRAADLDLAYRSSSLRTGATVGVVLGITMTLAAADGLGTPVRYQQLASALGVGLGERASVGAVREAVLRLRGSKGMLLSASDPDSVSAGSFFTNPIVGERFAMGLPAEAPRFAITAEAEADRVVELTTDAATGTILPPLDQLGAVDGARVTAEEPQVKLSAAWLIEHAGVRRGFRLPGSGIGVSTKHTLALVNLGGGTAAEVAELARYIQSLVASEFGVLLQPEPILIGLEL